MVSCELFLIPFDFWNELLMYFMSHPYIFNSLQMKKGVILYIMVTGFPPYDMPAREDERFQIICNGDLMKQLEAWESEYT